MTMAYCSGVRLQRRQYVKGCYPSIKAQLKTRKIETALKNGPKSAVLLSFERNASPNRFDWGSKRNEQNGAGTSVRFV